MPYADLNGIAAYYEQHGAGDPVLLLHGGFCSIETWQPQIEALSPHYLVHAPERPGQGRTPDREGPITYDDMVADTLAYLDHAGVARTHVIGFSDGAITGLRLAMEHPGLVRSLVAISGNLSPDCFGPDGTSPAPEEEPEEPPAGTGADTGANAEEQPEEEDPEWAEIRAAYDRLSPDGPEHGDAVLEKLMTLWTSHPDIPAADLAAISAPTLVLAGDGDSIPTEHTVLIRRSIPGAQLCIVPDAGHLAASQRPDLVNDVLTTFLGTVP